MQLQTIADNQKRWVTMMAPTEMSPLENLAMICAAIADAMDEASHDHTGSGLAQELAEMVLRSLQLAEGQHMPLSRFLDKKYSCTRDTEHCRWGKDPQKCQRSLTGILTQMMVHAGKAVNECRDNLPTDYLGVHLAGILAGVVEIACSEQVDLQAAIESRVVARPGVPSSDVHNDTGRGVA